MTARVAGAVMGRPSNSVMSERLEGAQRRIADLQDEVTALRAERSATGTEIEAQSRRIQLAVWNQRDDLALHVAGRLDALAASLRRRGTA